MIIPSAVRSEHPNACSARSKYYYLITHNYEDITVFSRILVQSRFISGLHLRYTRTDARTELTLKVLIDTDVVHIRSLAPYQPVFDLKKYFHFCEESRWCLCAQTVV